MLEVLSLINYSYNGHGIRLIFSAGLVLLLGIYIFFQNRKSAHNVVFFLLTMTLFIWLAGFSMVSFSVSERVAMFWSRVVEVGVVFIPSNLYLFAASFTRRLKDDKKIIYFNYFVSTIFCAFVIFTNLFVADMQKFFWGYYSRYGLMAYIFMAFIAYLFVLAIIRFYDAWSKARIKRNRDQLQVIMMAFLLAYVAIIDFLPHFGVEIYPFGYIFIFLFTLAITDSVMRYRVMLNDPALIAEFIISTMFDSLILFNREGKITNVNQATSDLLGYKEKEIIGQPIDNIFAKEFEGGDGKGLDFYKLGQKLAKEPVVDYDLFYQAKLGEKIPVVFSATKITNENGELIGTVCIAHDLSRIYKLRQEEKEKAEALRKLKEDLERIVDERTTELKEAKKKLEEKVASLEEFHDLAVGRELAMIEMEKKIKELEDKIQELESK
jgi:PAS domain S-box-containing protein